MKYPFLLTLIIGLLPINLFCQTQLGASINGVYYGDFAGWSVAMSYNGNRVAFGAPINDNAGLETGLVRVYDWNGANWIKIGNDISGASLQDKAGHSVSLSADGNILAVGAPYNSDGGGFAGEVRVFQLIGSTWTQIGNDIEGLYTIDYSGISLELSGDGSRLIIGARGLSNSSGPTNDTGRARVFGFNGSDWVQMGNDIIGEGLWDEFGGAVAISSNGSRVAVGAEQNDSPGYDSGQVKVYQWNGSTWNQLGNTFSGDNGDDRLGSAVSLSSSGSRVAIGSIQDHGSPLYDNGSVKIYEWNGSAWNLLGSTIFGEASLDYSGVSVSLSDDGSKVGIGAYLNDGNGPTSGQARAFEWNGNSWQQIGNDIDGTTSDNWCGFSVGISGDGTTLAVGSPHNSSSFTWAGQVRVFDLASTSNPYGCTDASACNYDPNASIDDGSCNPIDCEGNCSGTQTGPAVEGTACDDNNSGTNNTIYDSNCNCISIDGINCSSSGGVLWVTNTNDSGSGSLRQAIICANTLAEDNVIRFNLSGSSPYQINPLTPLPRLTDDGTTIDGTTQPGYAFGSIIIDGNNTSGGNSFDGGISVYETSNCSVYGLYIKNFRYSGVRIYQSTDIIIGGIGKGNIINSNGYNGIYCTFSNNIDVIGNYVGVGPSGTTIEGNDNDGINIAGGVTSNVNISNNLASNNEDYGIRLSNASNANVDNNLVGTDHTGTLAFGNERGMIIWSAEHITISNNVISGSRYQGLYIQADNGGGITDNGCSYNIVVIGNKIGTDISGLNNLANGSDGINVQNCGENIFIGGTSPDEKNIIAYNERGIRLGGATSSGKYIDNYFIIKNEIFCNDNDGIYIYSTHPMTDIPDISSASTQVISGAGPTNSIVEVFISDNSECPTETTCQGRYFLGSAVVDASGQWGLNAPFSYSLGGGDLVTAVATAFDGYTSEFSSCETVVSNCVTSINHTGTITSGTYEAEVDINSSARIYNPSVVNYKAGDIIMLGNGFECRSGATLNITIEDCNQ